MIENGDSPADWERGLLATIAAQRAAARMGEEPRRVRTILDKLTDAQLIESARKIAGARGPLSELISVLLDRFEAHMLRSWNELTEARAAVERLAKTKSGA